MSAGEPRVARFAEMLDRFNAAEEPERAAIEAEIDAAFGVEKTVLVLDMSGFSLAVQRYGLVHYLSMIRQMRRVAGSVVESGGGVVVKFDADNMFAVFDDVRTAIEGAVAICRALARHNSGEPAHRAISASVGISAGRILLLGEDFFGDAVNLASKLGEDIARGGEILVERRSYRGEAPGSGNPGEFDHEEMEFSVSGLSLPACRIGWR